MAVYYTSPSGRILQSDFSLDDVACTRTDLEAKGAKVKLTPLNELALRIFVRRHCRKKTVTKT